MFPAIERFGMLMLTIGPVMNIMSSQSFQLDRDRTYLFNRQWCSSETLEVIGISVLDVSLIDMEEILVLIAEVTGFLILCCAAILQFEYSDAKYLPIIYFRLDMVHSSECFGLILLIIVAYGQYQIKVLKHQQQHQSLSHPISI